MEGAIFNHGIIWRLVSFTFRPLYPGEKDSSTHCIAGCVGLTVDLDAPACRESNPGLPAHGQSPY
jgi:hypothetical protein